MFQGSFWPALFAFFGVTFGMLVLAEFVLYVAARYRERYLQEAGTELDDILIQMPPSRVLDLSIALSVTGAVVIVVIMSLHAESFPWRSGIAAALAAGAALFPLPRLVLRVMRTRRIDKFNIQLEDALNMISSALKSGFSINQALDEVADQQIHPLSVEFRLLTQEIRLGVPLEQALENMTRRLGSADFELVATAISTARKTGGELTGTLERVAGLIRERVRIANKIRALTAMGRLQAIMIGSMPFLLLWGMYYVSPVMIRSFFDSGIGYLALFAVAVLDLLGFLWIRRITKIEV